MCEIAAYLSSRASQGRQVARSCIAMAASWACQIKEEMDALNTAPPSDSAAAQLRSSLKVKCAIAHCCAVLCFGGASLETTDSTDASSLLLHLVHARLHTISSGKGMLAAALHVLTDQCSWVMARQVEALDAAAGRDSGVLDSAVRSVFGGLHGPLTWQRSSSSLGCYLTVRQGQVYSINLLTGAVLCNGLAPGHLPATILLHDTYQRLFGSASFEVCQLAGAQHGAHRTAQPHGGRFYTFRIQGKELCVSECPTDPETGEMQVELELELLPRVPLA